MKNADAAADYSLDIHHSTLQTNFQCLLLACNSHPAIDENIEQDRQCTDNLTLRRVPATIVTVAKM